NFRGIPEKEINLSPKTPNSRSGLLFQYNLAESIELVAHFTRARSNVRWLCESLSNLQMRRLCAPDFNVCFVIALMVRFESLIVKCCVHESNFIGPVYDIWKKNHRGNLICLLFTACKLLILSTVEEASKCSMRKHILTIAVMPSS